MVADQAHIGRHVLRGEMLLLHQRQLRPVGVFRPQRQNILGALERAAAGQVKKAVPVSRHGLVAAIL
ncbi:hypothetical protein D3C87_2133050 [compost metagenome]